MKKKILIVGATGFIGYWLAKRCLEQKFSVYSISKNKPKKTRYLKKVHYINCDISNKKELKKKFPSKVKFIVNLGGYVNHKEKIKTFKSHFNGCKNLIDLTKKKKIELFIQMSSSGEYEKHKSPHSESQITAKPTSKYNLAKFLATKYLLKNLKKYKYPFIVLRLYQAFGPRQDINRLIPIVIEACLKKRIFPCSSGRQFRDFIYIDDLVDLIMKCIKSNVRGEIFNVGSGKPINVKYIINLIRKKIKNGEPKFGKLKLRKDEKKYLYPRITKAKKYFNWKPRVSFIEGLNKTIQFYTIKERENSLNLFR